MSIDMDGVSEYTFKRSAFLASTSRVNLKTEIKGLGLVFVLWKKWSISIKLLYIGERRFSNIKGNRNRSACGEVKWACVSLVFRTWGDLLCTS
jgi:hypothetical protein